MVHDYKAQHMAWNMYYGDTKKDTSLQHKERMAPNTFARIWNVHSRLRRVTDMEDTAARRGKACRICERRYFGFGHISVDMRRDPF
ncbi:hypothetical protein DPV78_007013 [Talaromyces pinophilus]|nr:hypothetical protein DPV78_007013 [Talaromyces pinophilus]